MCSIETVDEPNCKKADLVAYGLEHLATKIEQAAKLAAGQQRGNRDVTARALQRNLHLPRSELASLNTQLRARRADDECLARTDEDAHGAIVLRDRLDAHEPGKLLYERIAFIR